MSAVSLAGAVRCGDVSAVGVVRDVLERVALVDSVLCAFSEVWAEDALLGAREVDLRVRGGEFLPLAGVPIGVKRWSVEVEALVRGGCVVVGRTAGPGGGTPWKTWGLGRHGRTLNPWRYDRTPGGSSAGSAVAVAAGLVPLATGSDGAGSVRIPAAWCGVVGLKATNGRLPSSGRDRTGLAAPGVLGLDAGDVLAAWRVLAGARVVSPPGGSGTFLPSGEGGPLFPPGEGGAFFSSGGGGASPGGGDTPLRVGGTSLGESTLLPSGASRTSLSSSGVDASPSSGEGRTPLSLSGIGTSPSPGKGRNPLSPDRVGAPLPSAGDDAPLPAAGGGAPPSRPLTAVWSPDLGFASPDPEPVALAEGAVRRLVEGGWVRLVQPSCGLVLDDPGPVWLALRTAGGGKAVERSVNQRQLDDVFRETDLLLTPTTPHAAHGHDGPGDRYSTALTWAFNLSGHPAVSVPAGVGADGCPVGLQIVARHGREELLLSVAQELGGGRVAPWKPAPWVPGAWGSGS